MIGNGSFPHRVITADGATTVRSTRGYLVGFIFTPGSDASTVTIADGATTVITLAGPLAAPSQYLSLSHPMRIGTSLVVTVTGTGAACTVFHRE